MSQPTPYEVIAMTAEIACAVLGAGTEFILVPLVPGLTEADKALALEKGMSFCGVYGFANREPVVHCEQDLESVAVMAMAAGEFFRRYAHMLIPERPGDAVDWLTNLAALQDTRTLPN